MPDPLDPFQYNPDSDDRTVIRPTPGRAGSAPPRPAAPAPTPPAAAAPAPAPRMERTEEPSPIDIALAGANPVIVAAGPLIALASRLRSSATQSDVPGLRDRIVRELKRYQQKLAADGVEQADIAHFALCALIDDLVLNTPWGVDSMWPQQTLSAVFHRRWADSGVRFYEVLNKLEEDPVRNIDILELMYLCLSLGFEGKFRADPSGAAKLARTRETLYQAIRRQRGEFERELSPHWQGVQRAHKPLSAAVPLWVFGLASAALVMAAFIVFSWLISNASNPVFAQIAQLPPTMPVAVRQPQPVGPCITCQTLRTVLAPEIARGIVEVKDDARSISVSIRGSGSFPAGSANLQGPYANMIERIAEGIKVESGRVTVSGHTDSTPIHTIRFPSNYELSLARAEAARDAIRARIPDPDRVLAEGRGDAEPVASNSTPEGREQNRRIEISILKRPAAG